MSFSAAGWGRGPAGAAQKPIRAENRSGRARRLDLKRIRRSKGSRGGTTPAIFPRGRSRPHGAPRRSVSARGLQGTCTSVFVCQVGDSTLQIISITGTGELRKALLLSYSEPALCLVSVGLSVDDYSPRVQTACRRMHADGGPCPELAGTLHPDRHGMDLDETGAGNRAVQSEGRTPPAGAGSTVPADASQPGLSLRQPQFRLAQRRGARGGQASKFTRRHRSSRPSIILPCMASY